MGLVAWYSHRASCTRSSHTPKLLPTFPFKIMVMVQLIISMCMLVIICIGMSNQHTMFRNKKLTIIWNVIELIGSVLIHLVK